MKFDLFSLTIPSLLLLWVTELPFVMSWVQTAPNVTMTSDIFPGYQSARVDSANVVPQMLANALRLHSQQQLQDIFQQTQGAFASYPNGGYPLSGERQCIFNSYLAGSTSASCGNNKTLDLHSTLRIPIFVDNHTDTVSSKRSFTSNFKTIEISELCRNRMDQLQVAFLDRKDWALQMVHSFGKPGPGVLQLRLNWFGSYERCLAVQAPPIYSMPNDSTSAWQGQYCLSVLTLEKIDQIPAILGVCFPEGCSETDVHDSLLEGVAGLQLGDLKIQSINQVHCQRRDRPWSSGGIAVMTLLSLLTAMICCATVVDKFFLTKPDTPTPTGPSDLSELPLRNTATTVGESTALLKRPITAKDTGQSRLTMVVLSFSLRTSLKRLLTSTNDQGQGHSSCPKELRCLHGLRVISMLWVMLGHTNFYAAYVPSTNLISAWSTFRKLWEFQPVFNGALAGDSFFLFSGLLVSYHSLNYMQDHHSNLNIFKFYFHRFWRLTPLYMLFIAIITTLSPHFGDGPLWPEQGLGDECRTNWWSNLLYINNFVHTDRMVKPQTYLIPSILIIMSACSGPGYLANDMQYFILSPVFIFALYYFPILGHFLCCLAVVTALILTGIISAHQNLSLGPSVKLELTSAAYLQYYIKPYCRAAPYFIGILVGNFLHYTHGRVHINKILNTVIWITTMSCCLAVVYGTLGVVNGSDVNQSVNSFYLSMSHVVWGLGVAWVIFACCTENGGLVNSFLSWKGWFSLSRLTYCVYLIHPVITLIYYLTLRVPFFYSRFSITFSFIGNTIISYMAATLLFLWIEAPLSSVENIFLKK